MNLNKLKWITRLKRGDTRNINLQQSKKPRSLDWIDDLRIGESKLARLNPIKSRWFYNRRYKLKEFCYDTYDLAFTAKVRKVPLFLISLVITSLALTCNNAQVAFSAQGKQYIKIIMVDTQDKEINLPGWNKTLSWEGSISRDGEMVDLKSVLRMDTEGDGYKFSHLIPSDFRDIQGTKIAVYKTDTYQNYPTIKAVYEKVEKYPENYVIVRSMYRNESGELEQVPSDVVKDHSFSAKHGELEYIEDGKILDLDANGLISKDLDSLGFKFTGKLEPATTGMKINGTNLIMSSEYNPKTPGLVYAIYENKNSGSEVEVPKGKVLVFMSWWKQNSDGSYEQVEYQGISTGGSVSTDGSQRVLVDEDKVFQVPNPGLRYKVVGVWERKGVDVVTSSTNGLDFIVHANDGYKGKRSIKVIVEMDNAEGVYEFYQDLDMDGNIIHTSAYSKREVKPGQKFKTAPMQQIKPGYEYVETKVLELQYDHDIGNIQLDWFNSDGKHPETGKEYTCPATGYAFIHVYKLAKLIPDKEIEIHIADFAIRDNKVIHINTWNGNLVDWIGRNTDENGGRGMLLKTGKDGKVKGLVKSPTNGFWPDKEHPHNLIVCKQLTTDGNPENSWSGLGIKREFYAPIPANGYEMEFDSSRNSFYVHFFWDFNDHDLEVQHIDEFTGKEIKERTYPSIEVGKEYQCKDWQEIIDGYTWTKCDPQKVTIEKGKKYIIKEYYKGPSVRVKHLDVDTNAEISEPSYPNIKVGESYSCADWKKSISNYTWQYCNPKTVTVEAGRSYEVIEYYKNKNSQDAKGRIVFNPDHTEWTRKGYENKKYPVNVRYVGDNPWETTSYCSRYHMGTCRKCNNYNSKGHCTSHTTYECPKYCGGDFKTLWGYHGTKLSCSNSSLDKYFAEGPNDNFNIINEGEYITLKGESDWGSKPDKDYHNQDVGSGHSGDVHHRDSYKRPPQIYGKSEVYYHIDWTKPTIDITPAKPDWVNKPHKFPVTIEFDDGPIGSGLVEVETHIADASHYNRTGGDGLKDIKTVEGGSKHSRRHYTEKYQLDDGIYAIRSRVKDLVGFETTKEEKVYYIDGTPPDVSLDTKPGIVPNDKAPSINSDCKLPSIYLHNLHFSDNLSGVATVDVGWTFGKNKSDAKFYRLWTHKPPHTLTDNWQEKWEMPVEKPVGDNMYLHVKVVDMAGNVTQETYGPFEDPIKLKEFKVTDVRDPMWDSYFRDKDGNKKSEAFFDVAHLPIDKDSNPLLTNAYVKKGYSYFFEVKSEYLYRDKDRIDITPTFYHVDKEGNRRKVDCYYEFEDDKFTKVGTKGDKVKLHINHRNKNVYIGELDLLRLTKDVRNTFNNVEWKGDGGWYPKSPGDVQYCSGKEQTWYGKYLLPETSKFVFEGEKPIPENILKEGNIIINFQIDAFKNGEESQGTDQTFKYVPSQWREEGGPKSSKYDFGDVMVHDSYDDTGVIRDRNDDFKQHNIH